MDYSILILGAIAISAIGGGIAYAVHAIRKAVQEKAEKKQLESEVQASNANKKLKQDVKSLPISDKLKRLRSPSKR